MYNKNMSSEDISQAGRELILIKIEQSRRYLIGNDN